MRLLQKSSSFVFERNEEKVPNRDILKFHMNLSTLENRINSVVKGLFQAWRGPLVLCCRKSFC